MRAVNEQIVGSEKAKVEMTGRKVALVGLSMVPSVGGTPKTMGKFAEALGADLISFTDQERLEREGTLFAGIHHIPCSGLLGRYYNWAPIALRREAESKALSLDLISCHGMFRYHANWVRKVAKSRKIPYWFVPHGQLDPYVYTYRSFVKKLWLSSFGTSLLRDAAHVIFSTEQERRKARWFYSGSNTTVVHWPVDVMNISSRNGSRTTVRRRHGIPEHARVLIFLGRLDVMKRPLETITALAKSARGDVHMFIVGPSESVTEEECQNHARTMGVAERVHVVGAKYGTDKNDYILASDAFVSLSHRENFGHTAAESLSACLPVILSPGNDLGLELKPYRCGWFMESDTCEEAAAVIREFADTSATTLQAMGERGRDFVASQLNFERFKQRVVDLAREAIAGRSGK